MLAILFLAAACQSQGGLVGPEDSLDDPPQLSASAGQLKSSSQILTTETGNENGNGKGKQLGLIKNGGGPGSDASAPVASFTYSCSGLSCTFTNTSSDADGDISHWTWMFGDGSSAVGENPSHTFESDGTYKVQLTVVDDSGNLDRQSQSISVASETVPSPPDTEPSGDENSPPTAAFDHACNGRKCDFTDKSQDSDGQLVSRRWEFGDGSTSSNPNPSHAYETNGDFMVTLTVQDDVGAEDGSAKQVSVVESEPAPAPNEPPVPSADVSCVDLTCSFDGSNSSDADGQIVSYDWDFGDGRNGSGRTLEHTYGESGSYVVRLSVTDDQGLMSSAEQEARVSKPAPSQAGSGLLFGFWGARHERGDMDAAVANHGISAVQVGNSNPVSVLRYLDAAASRGVAYSFRIVGGHYNYKRSDGSFDVGAYKAQVDAFWQKANDKGITHQLLDHIADGTWWGVMLLDDVSFFNPQPTAAEFDEITRHIKSYAPNLACWTRQLATQLPPGTYTELDLVIAGYRGKNMGPIEDWLDKQIAVAASKGVPNIAFSINVEKGNGSSGVVSTTKSNSNYMLSAQEILDYGRAILSRPETAALLFWEYDSGNTTIEDCPDKSFADYFDSDSCVPGIANAMAQLSTRAKSLQSKQLLR